MSSSDASESVWNRDTDPIGTNAPPLPPLVVEPRPYLVGLAGQLLGVVHDLRSTTVIGRHLGVDVPLPDTEVSRLHARIELRDGEALLVDAGSRNGTFVNDVPVREVKLKEGDKLRFGSSTVLKFTWGNEEVRAARQRLTVTQDELGKAQAKLVQAQKLAAIGQLVAGVGHELLNPLSFVVSNLDYLKREMAEKAAAAPKEFEELMSALSDVQDGAERIRVVMSDLQDFSRHIHERRFPVDPRVPVEEAIRATAAQISERAKLTQELGEVPRVSAVEKRLTQVVVNLLVNAAQAITPGQVEENHVRVTTRTDAAGNAVIEVQDSGCGIPQEIRGRIFDPYFSTKPVGKGTGLGLSISQAIVAAHQGEITLDSTVGQGSTFRVTLPPYTPPPAGLETGVGVKLWLVDSDPDLRRELSTALPGAAVLPLDVPGATERLVQEERPQLIFLTLGEGDEGVNFFRRLPMLAPALQQRVVFVRGSAMSSAAETLLATTTNPRIGAQVPGMLGPLVVQWLSLWED